MERGQLSIFDKILGTLLAVIVFAVACQIIWRYIFNNSLSWTEEFSRYIYAWLIFIGTAAGVRSESHINVDIFSARLRGKGGKVLTSIHCILMVFVQAYLFYYGVKFVIGTQGSYSTALRVPMGIFVNTSLPIACIIGIIFSINKLAKIIRHSDEIMISGGGKNK